MTIVQIRDYSVEKLAEEYARSRTVRSRPISMKAAIRAVRSVLPENALSDGELANVIAAKAIGHGHAIEFDHP